MWLPPSLARVQVVCGQGDNDNLQTNASEPTPGDPAVSPGAGLTNDTSQESKHKDDQQPYFIFGDLEGSRMKRDGSTFDSVPLLFFFSSQCLFMIILIVL